MKKITTHRIHNKALVTLDRYWKPVGYDEGVLYTLEDTDPHEFADIEFLVAYTEQHMTNEYRYVVSSPYMTNHIFYKAVNGYPVP